MFCGIVEAVGRIEKIEELLSGQRYHIEAPILFSQEICAGQSLAVNGACLTVCGWLRNIFWTDTSPESLEKTAFKLLNVNDLVNLERPLKLSDRIHGHLVTGHIDGVGRLLEREDLEGFSKMTFSFSKKICESLIEKGSIAIDGISLTVNQVTPETVEVMVIPETLKKTTWGSKKVGDPVQVECDLIGKYIKKWVVR